MKMMMKLGRLKVGTLAAKGTDAARWASTRVWTAIVVAVYAWSVMVVAVCTWDVLAVAYLPTCTDYPRTRPVSDKKQKKQRKEATAAELASRLDLNPKLIRAKNMCSIVGFDNSNRAAVAQAAHSKQTAQREAAKTKVSTICLTSVACEHALWLFHCKPARVHVHDLASLSHTSYAFSSVLTRCLHVF
jgi:hypothetical protein